MTTSNLIYLPPDGLPRGVLAQFLPRLPAGAAARWLKQTLPERSGQWVVDPFGASPHLALEAARAGYRVLVISNNPITRFMLELLASPPSEAASYASPTTNTLGRSWSGPGSSSSRRANASSPRRSWRI